MTTHTVIVTGGRDWADWRAVWRALDALVPTEPSDLTELTVRHGACPTGADEHAADWCEEFAGWYDNLGFTIVEDPHPADWRTHGNAAGPLRNADMVKLGADEVLAFPDPGSKGTYGCIDLAVRAGIATTIRRLPTDPPKRIRSSRASRWRKPPAAVYVGRPGRFGNPFSVAEFGRDEAVDRFRRHLEVARGPVTGGWVDLISYPSDEEIRRVLAGRDLACWCGPDQRCHADVLLEVANGGTNG